ncbi:hypothetical protein ATPR_0692 [Acetobacter tropicalis NBRC 101654]|uniref:Uncharacterized protein n=1 Tax=Acetobacter tropicalis NBRC 101654 TaxID=749388 RepID=F7VBE8_9PROT|nr:hypothetical protein ATPR_0692 [Acetobacter tropicalis NBRC 101654]
MCLPNGGSSIPLQREAVLTIWQAPLDGGAIDHQISVYYKSVLQKMKGFCHDRNRVIS